MKGDPEQSGSPFLDYTDNKKEQIRKLLRTIIEYICSIGITTKQLIS